MKHLWLTAKLDIVESLGALVPHLQHRLRRHRRAALRLRADRVARARLHRAFRLLVTYIQLAMAILPIFVLITTVRSVAATARRGVFEYLLRCRSGSPPGSGARSSAAT